MTTEERWRDSYDAWKLSGPHEPDSETETEEEERARLDAEARAENAVEDRAMEDHFERKCGDGRE